MSEQWFMRQPCASCPFRRDVRPFLRPERAEDIAYSTSNPYNDFTCHKTLEHDDEEGETVVDERSLTCAGFLAMQISESGRRRPKGFEPSDLVYADPYEMVDAYEEAAERGAA